MRLFRIFFLFGLQNCSESAACFKTLLINSVSVDIRTDLQLLLLWVNGTASGTVLGKKILVTPKSKAQIKLLPPPLRLSRQLVASAPDQRFLKALIYCGFKLNCHSWCYHGLKKRLLFANACLHVCRIHISGTKLKKPLAHFYIAYFYASELNCERVALLQVPWWKLKVKTLTCCCGQD